MVSAVMEILVALLLLVCTKVHFLFRNGCVRGGPSVVFAHFPHQSLRRLLLFILEAFPVSDLGGDSRRLLHVSLSIPEERSRIRHCGSGRGGLHRLNHADGGIGHQNRPHSDTIGEFVLHVFRRITGTAGFQGAPVRQPRPHCCHGDILFCTAADSRG